MPADDRLRLDDVEGVSPARPDRAEQIPDRPVSPSERRSARIALQDFDLMAKG